jgi:hypothetical protein
VLITALIASIVTALVVGGIAWAAIPDGSGVIQGCYSKRDGTLRVVDDPTACNITVRHLGGAFEASVTVS